MDITVLLRFTLKKRKSLSTKNMFYIKSTFLNTLILFRYNFTNKSSTKKYFLSLTARQLKTIW